MRTSSLSTTPGCADLEILGDSVGKSQNFSDEAIALSVQIQMRLFAL